MADVETKLWLGYGFRDEAALDRNTRKLKELNDISGRTHKTDADYADDQQKANKEVEKHQAKVEKHNETLRRHRATEKAEFDRRAGVVDRPVAARGLSQKLERAMGMDPTVVLGESPAERRQLGQILSKRERMGAYASGGMRGMGMLGAAAMAGHAGMQGLQSYEQATIGQTTGQYSGSLTGAATGQIGYERGVQRAASSAAFGIGGAGAAVGAMASLSFIPGLIVAGTAMAVAQVGSAIAEGYIGRAQAKETAAVSTLGNWMAKRGALSAATLPLLALGQEAQSQDTMLGQAGKYGIGVQQQQAIRLSYARAGGGLGGNISENDLYAAQQGMGLESGAIGGLFRGTARGGGARLDGGDQKAYLEGMLSAAKEAGIQTERYGEYLQRIASSSDRMAERGITLSLEGQEAIQRGLEGAGFGGFQGRAVIERTQERGMGLASSIQEMIMPQAARNALMLRAAFSGGGGIKGALGRAKGMAEGDPRLLQEAAAGLSPDLASALFGLELGMPFDGEKIGDYSPKDRPGGTGGFIERMFALVAGNKEFEPVSTQATIDAMQTFGTNTEGVSMSLGNLKTALDEFVMWAGVANENMSQIGLELARKARAGLTGEDAASLPGAGQIAFVPQSQYTWGGED